MVKKVPANNELHIVDPPKKFKLAYPISTFTYAIVPHGAPKKAELEQFINYAMTTGQKYGPALDFAPLPKVVLDAAKAALARSLVRTGPAAEAPLIDPRAGTGRRSRAGSLFRRSRGRRGDRRRRRPGWRGGGDRR